MLRVFLVGAVCVVAAFAMVVLGLVELLTGITPYRVDVYLAFALPTAAVAGGFLVLAAAGTVLSWKWRE